MHNRAKLTLAVNILAAMLSLNSLSAGTIAATTSAQDMLGNMPLVFTQNDGQWDKQVYFKCDASGATVWICKDQIIYQYLHRDERTVEEFPASESSNLGSIRFQSLDGNNHRHDSIEQSVIAARFVNPSPNVQVAGEGLTAYKCNYFIGSDPTKWYTNVPNYQKAILKGVYEGVDLRFFADELGRLTYQYEFATAANRNQVQIEYERIEPMSVSGDSKNVAPSVLESIIGFVAVPASATGPFDSLSSYERLQSQIITRENHSPYDVQLVFSTFLGGADPDGGYSIAVDSTGSVYMSGATQSATFPMQNPYDGSENGNLDVVVCKLAPNGSALVYSTFLGGGVHDYGYGIAVDASGSIYLTGSTNSTDFPTQNSYDDSLESVFSDAFVAKLSPAGDHLLYSTYLGGQDEDYARCIAIDALNHVYIVGSTRSPDFPTQNAMDGSFNGDVDAFVCKLSSLGNSLVYSTYVGGTGSDYGYGIAIDASGSSYATGLTSSLDFPMQNACDAILSGTFEDAFVSKLSSVGNVLVYSTYLGGVNVDRGYGIAVDPSGNAYVTGETASFDFPTQNAYDASHNGNIDAFVSKLSANGSALVYSTYLGGASTDIGWGIAIDASGSSYVAGFAASSNFPTQSAYDATHNGNYDVFVSKLSSAGNALAFSTFIGGASTDGSYDFAIDTSGSAYIVGITFSSNYPVLNAFDSSHNGNYDAFVSKLNVQILYLHGDADNNGIITISDAVYLINYIFSGGPAPSPLLSGDADCSGAVTISDAVYLINYIFAGGPAPC